MSAKRFLFVDDAAGANTGVEQFKALLSQADLLQVDAVRPDRTTLLVPEAELDGDIDGYILDINLKDQVDADGQRFLGTGAGLAQDLRLLQAAGGADGQRPRPIVRLCAAQVFQKYIAGDSSTDDLFDLGFDKETIADVATSARAQIAALPDIYEGVIAAKNDVAACPATLGLNTVAYPKLHSRFRAAFEAEIARKAHEAALFLLQKLLLPTGLLVDETVLAIRLGVDRAASGGWPAVRDTFAPAQYSGRGSAGFQRWWFDTVLTLWGNFSNTPAYQLTAAQRCEALSDHGFADLSPLVATEANPGDRPWLLSVSDEPELRLPCDPRFAFQITVQVPPWCDQPVWCLEKAKRNRRSPELNIDSRERLAKLLQAPTT